MKRILFSAAVCGALVSHASAAALTGDTFTYPDGSIVTVSGGAWISHGGGSTPLNVVSGKAFINQGDSTSGRDDVNKPFNTTFDPATDNTSVLYSGFTANWSSLPNGGSADGSYFAHFKTSGSSQFYGRVSATTNGAAAGSFRVGITGASTTAADTIEYTTDLSLNTDYRIVTRLDLATDKVTLWVNPVNAASPSVTSTDTISYSGLINSYALRQGTSGSGTTIGFPGALTVDNLSVATTFAEALANPVPEPASLSLIGLAGAALIRRRK